MKKLGLLLSVALCAASARAQSQNRNDKSDASRDGGQSAPATSTSTDQTDAVRTSPGSFAGGQMNLNFQSRVNGCDPAKEYHSVQYNYATEGLTGCVTGGLGSTHQITGVAGYATSITPVDAVGGYFQGRGLANNTHAFGINPVAQDIAGLTSGVTFSNEFDIQPYNPPSAYAGGYGLDVRLINNLQKDPGAYGFTALNISVGGNYPSTAAWNRGINFSQGAVANYVLNINPLATATAKANYGTPAIRWLESILLTGGAKTLNWTLATRVAAGTDPAYDMMYWSLENPGAIRAHHLTLTSYQGMDLAFIHSDSTFSTITVPSTLKGVNTVFTLPPVSGTGMVGANNLSDVTNKPAALANLGAQPSLGYVAAHSGENTDITSLGRLNAAVTAPGFFPQSGAAGPQTVWFDDFYSTANNASNNIGLPVGASCVANNTLADANHPGNLLLTTGSGGLGTGITCGLQAASGTLAGLNAGPAWTWETAVNVPSLPAATAASYQAGLVGMPNRDPWTTGIEWYLSSVNGTPDHWYCRYGSTSIDTQVPAVAAAWTRLTMINDGDRVHWYINGTQVCGNGVPAANVPSNTMYAASWSATSLCSGNSTMAVDYVNFERAVVR
jgi:hypothetical protein